MQSSPVFSIEIFSSPGGFSVRWCWKLTEPMCFRAHLCCKLRSSCSDEKVDIKIFYLILFFARCLLISECIMSHRRPAPTEKKQEDWSNQKLKFNFMLNKTHWPDQKKRKGGPSRKFKFDYMLNKTHCSDQKNELAFL